MRISSVLTSFCHILLLPSVSCPWKAEIEIAEKACKSNSHQQCTKHYLCFTELFCRCSSGPASFHKLTLCTYGKQTATQARHDRLQSHLVPGTDSSASRSSRHSAGLHALQSRNNQMSLILTTPSSHFCPSTRFLFLSQNTPVFLFLPLKTQALAFQNAN